ncbi:M23 family metallopeptidase [Dendrosporobacter sp. 1207_IL3150]|uniref:M23 family metallopeptidase n=1 Tax=Dendrosporobacter sp. 1207_IL3150 TaxID=3084054 RepID=UPI002FDADDC1
MNDVKKPERQEYTIMIVPHKGQGIRSFRIRAKVIKYGVSILCAGALLLTGTYVNYQHQLNVAAVQKSELDVLRSNKGSQEAQIEQLAKDAAGLQEDLNRLSSLEAELRRLVNSEQSSGVSRSGISRSVPMNSGQGGPLAKPAISEISEWVELLKSDVKAREQSIEQLRNEVIAKNARMAVTPSIWPTEGDITSRFGWRDSPIGWGRDWHPGIDIANSYGTPIIASADGEVVESGWNGGYGKMVKIDHGNGIATVYAHNSRNIVSVGSFVKKGETIAYMGSTGYSTGPHLHYEVRVNGNAVNPASFL